VNPSNLASFFPLNPHFEVLFQPVGLESVLSGIGHMAFSMVRNPGCDTCSLSDEQVLVALIIVPAA
jgi:hypothetical protein